MADEKRMEQREMVALAPVIVGAVNWGMVGLFGFDLVRKLTGTHGGLRRTIYTTVGAAGVYTLWRALQERRAPMAA